MDLLNTKIEMLHTELLEENIGQINDVPANPRTITRQEYRKLKKSIREDNLLGAKPLNVYPADKKYIVLDGNQRLKAVKDLKLKEVPCIILPDSTPKKVLRKIVILSNSHAGEWNVEMLTNAWNSQELDDWSLRIPEWEGVKIDNQSENPEDADSSANKGYAKRDKIDFVEELMNKAMQQYCGEFTYQIDHSMKAGWICTGMTPGYAKLQFLKAKYYGVKYQRKLSLIFTPKQFYTSANTCSYYDQLKKSAEKGKAGIAGFRKVTDDNSLIALFAGSYPIGGSRMPLDFPVELGRELIAAYANKGRVLDPCHGWGGRLISSLLEEVEEYIGVDPSPDAHEGVSKIYDTFKEYQSTKCKLIRQPYEKTQIEGGFDFAITSPPYFDVEQYAGEEQAHVKYNNYDRWKECFYRPLIELTMDRLKEGCYFALQVGSQSYPLKKDAIEIAEQLGYKTSVYKTQCLNNNNALHNTDREKSECVLLIKKTKHKQNKSR